jgi:hypothetical protein
MIEVNFFLSIMVGKIIDGDKFSIMGGDHLSKDRRIYFLHGIHEASI